MVPAVAYALAVGDAPRRRRRGGGRRPAGRVVPAVAALLLLAGCRVDVAVEVRADAGGGGHVRATVTLDEEAAAQVPDLAEQLRVDDLEAAGWEVEGPSPAPGGGTGLEATKEFASPEGAVRALEQLGGIEGPFRSLRLTRERSFWKTRTSLAGSVDLTPGLDVFGDQALSERLGGPTLGVDPAAVERELGRPLADLIAFEVVARLPGDVESNAPHTAGGRPAWPVPLGQSVPVTATSQAWNVANIAFAALAVAAALALVAVLVRRSRAVSWG